MFGCQAHGFTVDSPVCLAAMHAGFLSDREDTTLSVEFFKEDKE